MQTLKFPRRKQLLTQPRRRPHSRTDRQANSLVNNFRCCECSHVCEASDCHSLECVLNFPFDSSFGFSPVCKFIINCPWRKKYFLRSTFCSFVAVCAVMVFFVAGTNYYFSIVTQLFGNNHHFLSSATEQGVIVVA